MVRQSAITMLSRGGIALLALAALVALPAPAVSRSKVLSAAQVNGELNAGYRMAAGDKLKVTVFDEPTLTGEYQVSVGGELAMPLIEAVPALGQTPRDLATAIGEKLKAGGYVLVPRVTVEIVQHRPFYILGEVKLPGEYPYTGDLTFEQAVARAGGFTPRASRKTILLRRQNWQAAERVRLDGTALKIAPGDTITVRESLF